MAVLHVTNLIKTFTTRSGWFGTKQTITAVNNISFALEQGEILGFLGPNGAGKTTTIEMLLGTLTPTSGSIVYFGQDFSTYRSNIMKRVTYASAYTRLPSRLSIWENLDIFARLYDLSAFERAERIGTFLRLFDMWDMRHKDTGALSAGQTTRVMLAKAFIPYPDIVLLDEPTASLDPDIAQEIRTFILEQRDQRNISVLFTSHNMDEVTQLCDRVLVLKQGSIIADSTPMELAASVASVTVHLIITQGIEQVVAYAQEKQIAYELVEREIRLEIDEHEIATFLTALAHRQVTYSQIAIDKPTLEDYFLSLVTRNTHD